MSCFKSVTELQEERGGHVLQLLDKEDTISFVPQYFVIKNNVVVQISLPRYCQEYVKSNDARCRVFGKI